MEKRKSKLSGPYCPNCTWGLTGHPKTTRLIEIKINCFRCDRCRKQYEFRSFIGPHGPDYDLVDLETNERF